MFILISRFSIEKINLYLYLTHTHTYLENFWFLEGKILSKKKLKFQKRDGYNHNKQRRFFFFKKLFYSLQHTHTQIFNFPENFQRKGLLLFFSFLLIQLIKIHFKENTLLQSKKPDSLKKKNWKINFKF